MLSSFLSRRALLTYIATFGCIASCGSMFAPDLYGQTTYFDKLWQNYPNGTPGAVLKSIGGNVQQNNFANTCTIRASRAFNYAGTLVPGPTEAKKIGMNVVSGADKRWYAYRVKEFHAYMVKLYGQPHITSKGGSGIPAEMKGKKGVIEFVGALGGDSTGHFDIWDGKNCKYQEYFKDAKQVYLWKM